MEAEHHAGKTEEANLANIKQKGLYAEAYNPFISLVPLTGIELVTFALRMRCSTD
jgi:hypothetical protein